MKSIGDLTHWPEKNFYFGVDVIRRRGELDTEKHRFWTNWVDRQRKRLVVSEGWPAFLEVMKKCASFKTDEDTLVGFLLIDMDQETEETVTMLNEFMKDKEHSDGVLVQRQRGAVYPVEGKPTMCIAAARTINVKKGLVHCPIGMSKSDWLMWVCKVLKKGKQIDEKNRRWFDIGAGFHALGMQAVHDYDNEACTCVCRSVPHFARLLYTTFKSSLGSTSDRSNFSIQIRDLAEQIKGATSSSERQTYEQELAEKEQLYDRMQLYPSRLDDSTPGVWVLDGVRMATPSFVTMISCMVDDYIVAVLPLLVISYSDAKAHLPAAARPSIRSVIEILQSLHERMLRIEASDRSSTGVCNMQDLA
jgi:hypothetical protein